MRRTAWNIFRGIGSILDIAPASRRNPIGLKRMSVRGSLRSDFERVGRHMDRAIATTRRELKIHGGRVNFSNPS